MRRLCERLEQRRLYFDDIFSFMKNRAERVNDLDPSLKPLTKFNQKLAPKKVHLEARELVFLGHHPFGRRNCARLNEGGRVAPDVDADQCE